MTFIGHIYTIRTNMAANGKEQKNLFLEGLGNKDSAFKQFKDTLARESCEINRHDSKAVADKNMAALRQELHVELLPDQDQKLFDRFTTGEVGSFQEAYRIFDPYTEITLDHVKAMTRDQLMNLALVRGVMSIAARVYLAKYIEKFHLQKINHHNGDIAGAHWWEFGNTNTLLSVFDNKANFTDPKRTFHEALTNRPSGIHMPGGM